MSENKEDKKIIHHYCRDCDYIFYKDLRCHVCGKKARSDNDGAILKTVGMALMSIACTLCLVFMLIAVAAPEMFMVFITSIGG